jgi:hypothetical protein
MVALATFLQTSFHPGFFFPRLSNRWQEPNNINPNEKLAGYSSSESRVV